MSEETPLSSADERTPEATPESPSPSWDSNGATGPGDHVDAAFTDAGGGQVRDADPPAAADDGSAFLANLASAMKEAATAERTRVAEDVDRRRETHLTGIETRRESEAGRIRQLADDDRTAIQTWVEAEQQRINQERDRRITAVDADLQASLAEHGAKIDAEKAQVEAAITSHRADLDVYFGTLEGETDPVAIAQEAGRRPVFPDLDAIGSDAAPGGPDRMIGVMASSRPTTKLSQAWAAWQSSTATAERGAAEPEPTAEAERSEPQPVEPETAPAETRAAGAYVPPAVTDPQINPVDPSPAPEPVGVAAGSGAATEDSGATEPAAHAQPASTFGGMSWLRRDKGSDQVK